MYASVGLCACKYMHVRVYVCVYVCARVYEGMYASM